MLIVCAFQFIPLALAIFLGEKASFHSLFSSILISGLFGGSLVLGFRSTEKVRVPRLTLFLPLWGAVCLALVAGLPFFFLFPEEGFFAAFYEGMSLITTNGTSAYEGTLGSLTAIELWRAMAAWIGGYLAICITLSLLTAMNIGGLQIHHSPMPFGDSEAGYPRLKATALALYPIYISVTFACFFFLWIGGTGLFDSLRLAMATISTTGLSGVSDVYTQNFWPQFVLAVFMLISLSNWDIHYFIYKKRTLHVGTNHEFRSALLLVAAAIIFLTVYDGTFNIEYIWQILFSAISAVATVGIVPEQLIERGDSNLPIAITMMALAGVGGATISACGGLKQLRMIVIYRAGRSELDRLAHPHAVHGLHYASSKIQRRDVDAIWLLLGSFVLVTLLGALALAILGIHFQDAFSMAFTAITLSGPLIHLADPYFGGFAGLKDVDYFILTILMLIGRVEASLFFALFAKSLWRG
ncbi:MAG: potassium transporter TrkG [Kordiimonas sp.]